MVYEILDAPVSNFSLASEGFSYLLHRLPWAAIDSPYALPKRKLLESANFHCKAACLSRHPVRAGCSRASHQETPGGPL